MEQTWTEAAQMIRNTLGQEGLDALADAMRSEYDLVSEGAACPQCDEDRVDWLVWQNSDEGEYVKCASCGEWYDPNEEVE